MHPPRPARAGWPRRKRVRPRDDRQAPSGLPVDVMRQRQIRGGVTGVAGGFESGERCGSLRRMWRLGGGCTGGHGGPWTRDAHGARRDTHLPASPTPGFMMRLLYSDRRGACLCSPIWLRVQYECHGAPKPAFVRSSAPLALFARRRDVVPNGSPVTAGICPPRMAGAAALASRSRSPSPNAMAAWRFLMADNGEFMPVGVIDGPAPHRPALRVLPEA